MGEIFRIFEAELPFAECMDAARNTCPLNGACRLKGLLCEALGAFYATLDRYSLRDLVADNGDLEKVFLAAAQVGADEAPGAARQAPARRVP